MPIDAYLNLGGLEGESPVREAVDTYQDALTDDAELFLLTFAEAVGFDSFDFEYRSISVDPAAGGAVPTEEISFIYSKIKYEVEVEDGRAGALKLAGSLEARLEADGLDVDAHVAGGGDPDAYAIVIRLAELSHPDARVAPEIAADLLL